MKEACVCGPESNIQYGQLKFKQRQVRDKMWVHGLLFFFPFPLHWRAKCKCHSFEKSSQVQVLPPYISLTSVNVVAMAPGYLLNARCTFAEIIRSISQRKGKQLNLQNKGHWSRYFWGAATQNNVGNNKTREGTLPQNISLHWGVHMSSVSRL